MQSCDLALSNGKCQLCRARQATAPSRHSRLGTHDHCNGQLQLIRPSHLQEEILMVGLAHGAELAKTASAAFLLVSLSCNTAGISHLLTVHVITFVYVQHVNNEIVLW